MSERIRIYIVIYFASMLMRLLELFSGTGSVGNVAVNMGYEVVSIDRDMPATHKCDIDPCTCLCY